MKGDYYDEDYNNLQKALSYLSPYRWRFLSAMLVVIIGLAVGLFQPYVFGILVDAIADKRFELIWRFVGLVFSFYFLNSFLNMIEQFITIKIGNSIILDVKADIYNGLMKLPIKAFDTMQMGEILHRIEGDASILSSVLVQRSISIMVDVMKLIGIGILMIKISGMLTVILLISFPLSLYISKLFSKRQRQLNYIIAQHRDGYFGLLAEIIASIKEIKALRVEKDFKYRLESQNKTIVLLGTEVARLGITSNFCNALIGGLGSFISLFVGTNFIKSGSMTLGSLVAFNTYAGQFYVAMRGFVAIHSTIQNSIVSINRLFDLLGNFLFTGTTSGTMFLKDKVQNIKINNVSFSYDGKKKALDSLTAEFKSKSIVAIVGHNGSGKTTLLNLILRFYDQQGGSISSNGLELQSINIDAWRSKIALLLQEPMMFRGTIIENMRYADPNATFSEIVEACNKVGLHEFFQTLPKGYDTILNDDIRLSVGERQRLAIARAILNKAEIYLFDEPMAALDGEIEHYISKIILELGRENLVIIIAHKLSTVELADWVLVLDAGRVVEEGTPSKLQENGEVYKRLFGGEYKVG